MSFLQAAAKTGCSVTAYNLSIEQVTYARQKAEERGLSDRVKFVHADYRHSTVFFDRIVSVGMLEVCPLLALLWHLEWGNSLRLGDSDVEADASSLYVLLCSM